jgi:acetyltransferase-like isoleucine patch superfamily enzyme
MIHPLALVENSHVGARTRVWQFASVIRGAHLGADCNIASGATIDGAKLGDHCIVGHNCSINPGVVIGNNVFIGPLVTFCNDGWPSVSKEGFDLDSMLSRKFISILIEDDVSIGAGAILMPGVTLGRGSMIGAGVIVERSIPPGSTYWRNGTWSSMEPGQLRKRMRSAR